LIVDGDTRNQKVLEVSLKKAGYRVVLADTIEAAFEYLGEETPDLVISETDLPDGDGFDFCRRLRDRSELDKTPFVFLAEEGEWTDKIQGLELGADDYLTRPVYVRELLTRVEALLQERERKLLSEDADTFEGDLADITVLDLLQTIDRENQTGEIRFEREDEEATLVFRDGDVLDAVCGKLQGEEALYRVMLWPEGEFVVEYREQIEAPEHIASDIDTLMMEGVERLEEWDRHVERLPSFERVFESDYRRMPDFLETVPEEVARVARLFDGVRTLREVVDASPVDDVTAVQIIARIFDEDVLEDVTPEETSEREESEEHRARSHLSDWLESPSGAGADEGAPGRTRRGMPGPREAGGGASETASARTRQTTREYYREVSEETAEDGSRDDDAPHEEYEVVEPDRDDEPRDDRPSLSESGESPEGDDEASWDEAAIEEAKARMRDGGAFEEVDLEDEGLVSETIEGLQEAEQQRRRREAEQLVEQQSEILEARPDDDEATSDDTSEADAEPSEEPSLERGADETDDDDFAAPGLGAETTEPDWLEDESDDVDQNIDRLDDEPPSEDDEVRREFHVEADRFDADHLEDDPGGEGSPAPGTSEPENVPGSPEPEAQEETPSVDDEVRPRESSPLPHPERDETARGISPWGEPDDVDASETSESSGTEDGRDVPVSFQRVESSDVSEDESRAKTEQRATTLESSEPPTDDEPEDAEGHSDETEDDPSLEQAEPRETDDGPAEETDEWHLEAGDAPSISGDDALGGETAEEADEASGEAAPTSGDDTSAEEVAGEADKEAVETDEYEAISEDDRSDRTERDAETGVSPVELEAREESDDIGRVSENGEIVRVEYDLGQSAPPPEMDEGDEDDEIEANEEPDEAEDDVSPSLEYGSTSFEEAPETSSSESSLETTPEADEDDAPTWGDGPADQRAEPEAFEQKTERTESDEENDVGVSDDADDVSELSDDADDVSELSDDVDDVSDVSEDSGRSVADATTDESSESSADETSLADKATTAASGGEVEENRRDSPLGARFADSSSDDSSEASSPDTVAETEVETDEVGRDEASSSDDSDEFSEMGNLGEGGHEEDFFVEDEDEEFETYADEYEGDDRWKRWGITAAIIGLLGVGLGVGIWQNSQKDAESTSSQEDDSAVATSEEPETDDSATSPSSESSSGNASETKKGTGLKADAAEERARALTRSVGSRAQTVASALDFSTPAAQSDDERAESSETESSDETASAEQTERDAPDRPAESSGSESDENTSGSSAGGADAKVARARQMLQSGRPGRAFSLLNQARRQDPSHDEVPTLLLKVGSRFQVAEQGCRAKRAYEAYLQMSPSGSQSDQIRSIIANQIQCNQ
jgi:DNA-binding response OmpR family regulator